MLAGFASVFPCSAHPVAFSTALHKSCLAPCRLAQTLRALARSWPPASARAFARWEQEVKPAESRAAQITDAIGKSYSTSSLLGSGGPQPFDPFHIELVGSLVRLQLNSFLHVLDGRIILFLLGMNPGAVPVSDDCWDRVRWRD